MDLDDETRQELMDSFNDHSEEIDKCLIQLAIGDDDDALNSLFRAIHSVKGNAGMLALNGIVEFAHTIEEVAQSLRAKRYRCNDKITEVFQLAMDRLRDLHERDVRGMHLENLKEIELGAAYLQLAKASPKDTDLYCDVILGILGVDLDDGADIDDRHIKVPDHSKESAESDLIFFLEISTQVDSKTPYWECRSMQLFDWAHRINQVGGSQVDEDQLSAAIYIHDLGMSFIPDDIINKKEKLTDAEINLIREHPYWGHGLLARMPRWAEAAEIVLQHHEHADGGGYPNQLTSKNTHPGAKIIALVDAFFAMLNGRADKSQRKSIVRAISEINARSNAQFDAEWVGHFNTMVRAEMKQGRI